MTTTDGSYADLMNTAGPIPVDEVVRVGIAVAAALQATHAAGGLHLGVTPAIIARGAAGPMLTLDAPPAAGTLVADGFAPHASPEALLGEPLDARSDVYSLASTMWTLLAGHPPFAVDADESLDPDIYQERVLRAPAPAVPVTGIPGWLQVSLRRAMAKQPEDRYPTAAAFADALRSHSNEPWAPVPAPIAPVAPATPVAPVSPAAPVAPAIPRQRSGSATEPERKVAAVTRSTAAAETSIVDSPGPASGRARRRTRAGDRVLVGAILVVGVAVLVTAVFIAILLVR